MPPTKQLSVVSTVQFYCTVHETPLSINKMVYYSIFFADNGILDLNLLLEHMTCSQDRQRCNEYQDTAVSCRSFWRVKEYPGEFAND